MLRIATIGTSPITCDFIDVVTDDPGAAFIGTLSRDAERAQSFTAEHGGTRAFTSLDELAASSEVDAVYIASPNALHHDQALSCIAGGKHVIVEKPFCSTAAEAQEVFDAAGKAGVVALEAIRPLHDPAFHRCEDVLPRLGRIRRANLHIGSHSSRYDDILAGRHTNIFDCDMATGALMDMGVYTVEPMVEMFGVPTSIICAGALLDAETRELSHGPIDGAGTILATYDDVLVELHFSKITHDLAASQIEAEMATFTIDQIETPRHASVRHFGKAERSSAKTGHSKEGDGTEELDLPFCQNTMVYELSDFLNAVENLPAVIDSPDDLWGAMAGSRHPLGHYRDVTLISLSIMDEARRQMGVRFPADRADES